jgi:hypothetical protein
VVSEKWEKFVASVFRVGDKRQQDFPEHWYLSTELHGVTSQNIVIFIVINILGFWNHNNQGELTKIGGEL